MSSTEQLTAMGSLRDDGEVDVKRLPATTVTVKSIGVATNSWCPGGTDFELEAADARIFRYCTNVTGLPIDLIQVDDTLEVTSWKSGTDFFPDQQVALARNGELILFSVRYWQAVASDLFADYDLTLHFEDDCRLMSMFDFERALLVTRDGETVRIPAGQRHEVADLTVVVANLYNTTAGNVDPPGDHRFAGFRTSR